MKLYFAKGPRMAEVVMMRDRDTQPPDFSAIVYGYFDIESELERFHLTISQIPRLQCTEDGRYFVKLRGEMWRVDELYQRIDTLEYVYSGIMFWADENVRGRGAVDVYQDIHGSRQRSVRTVQGDSSTGWFKRVQAFFGFG